jgi:signal peptidase II
VTARQKQLAWILAVVLCVACLDQVSKTIIRTVFPEVHFGEANRFFQLTHQRNPGIVGGIFRDRPLMALAAPVLATLVLIYLFTNLDTSSRIQSTAFGMIAGGALGNLTDRLRLGWVTDWLQFDFYFIPFNFPWKHYPAFNVADSCICTGVFLLFMSWYFVGEKHVSRTV